MSQFDDHLLRLALQGSAEPMVIVDAGNCIRWANLAAHEHPNAVLSQPLAEYLSSAQLTAAYCKTNASQELLYQLSRLPFGEVRWGLQTISEQGQANDSVLLIRWRLLAESPERFSLISFHDRGRRRSDPGPAIAALKNQQLFINQLIHELRTPLAIASGSLRRVAKKLHRHVPELAADVSGEHLHVAQQELKRITRLIDHLSLLTDIDAGSQRWRMMPIPIGRMLEHWFDELPEKVRQRLLISIDPESEHHYLKADIEAMKIVLNNIVDNACRYSPDDAPVLIYVCPQPSRVCLYVADWGSGIPADLRDQVFDRFRRLEHHRDPARADGAGLGLAVTRALLNHMNADVVLLPVPETRNLRGGPKTVLQVCFSSQGQVHEDDRTVFDVEQSLISRDHHELIAQLKRVIRMNG